ncbi:hypothetical protein [Chlamydiifrater volucris]|uniref:hypothetical protein n=1 Tax=Chlamydiifrater volucris TaxID=2681470 RepID=UPI001FEBD366|nr:hypothetical protein [Chlamydiifrater volucris]
MKALFEECIINSWWVVLLFLVGMFIYDRAIRKLSEEETRLRNRLCSLEKKISHAQELRSDLILRIENRSRPEAVEMILMERLGLIPKGYIKVCPRPSATGQE